MASVRHLGFVLRMFGPITKRSWWSLSLCKFLQNSVFSFEDMLFSIFCAVSLKMPIHAPFEVFWGKTGKTEIFCSFIFLVMQQPGIEVL